MKRIISIAVIIMMLTSLINTGAVLAADDNYDDVLECLSDLGAITYDEETDMESAVSREEYCVMIMKYFGFDAAQYITSTTPFLDVETNRESFSAIRYLYDMGYISGDSSRRFYPEKELTAAEAVSIIIKILGYQYSAINKGGTNEAYMSTAYDLDILKDSIGGSASIVSFKDVYTMLYNTLEVPILEIHYSDTRTTFSAKDNNTVLKAYYKAEKKRGIVTANQYTGLSFASAATPDDMIAIDDISYQTAKDYSSMLGMQVIYYVSYKNDDSGVIVHMHEQNNTILQIDSDDINSIENDKILYYPNGAESGVTKTAKLEQNCDVIYNDASYTGYGTLESMEIHNGNIELIDNNNDGSAEVLKITEYENYYISGIDKSSKTLYDYDESKSIVLNDSINKIEFFDAEGNEARFSGLQKNTLVSIAKSKGDTDCVIKVYICSDVIEGVVESISEDKYVISGEQYEKAYGMNTKIELSASGKFYLDINGKLAAFKSSVSDDFVYGIVYRISYDPNTSETNLRVFNENENFEDYTTGEKITLNRESIKIKTQRGADYFHSKVEKGMLIRYKTDETGELLTIVETPVDMILDNTGNKVPSSTENLKVLYEGSSFKYRNGLLDGKVMIDENTMIFSVPKSDNWDNTNMFGKLTSGSFSGGSSYSKNYKTYSIGKNEIGKADIMVIEDMTKGSIGNNTNMIFVTSISDGISGNNEVCKVISGISSGNTVEYYCTNSTLITDAGLNRGDVIRVGFDSSSDVNKIQKIYNCDGSAAYGALLAPKEGVCENTASFDSEFRVVIGSVESISGSTIKFTMKKISNGTPYNDTQICIAEDAKVICYESGERFVKPSICSVNDILNDDVVIMRMNLAKAKEIIILR